MRHTFLNVLIFTCCIFSKITLDAQDASDIRCAFHQNHIEENTTLFAFEDWMGKKRNTTIQNILEKTDDEIMKIPVIFHILHYGENKGEGTNLGQERIQAQLEQINNDLRRKEGTSGYNNHQFGADIEIELVLSLYNEAGYALPEAGINRVNTIERGFGSAGTNGYSDVFINSIIKPATQWNPTEYLNVWIGDLNSGTLGYAQFPEASGLEGLEQLSSPYTDGIVLNYKIIGSTDFPNPEGMTPLYESYNRGRTFTHELGHWLGLRHIWGDGNCETDDYCEDTPSSEGANYGCPSNIYSCGSQDMVENYMDYTNDACMNTFTEDQKIRIMTVMHNSPRRVELLSSKMATPHESLRLMSFDVRLEDWDAILTWKTDFENNSDEFVIFKSIDNENFYELGRVDAAGFSEETLEYEFIDENPHDGTNYYKLVQRDFLGEMKEVGFKSFEYYLGFEMIAHPNPTKGDLNISVWSQSEGEALLRLHDIHGKTIFFRNQELIIGQNDMDLDIDMLPKGLYFLQIVKGPWQRVVKLKKE